MEAIDDAIDKYRGYGICLFLYYQSLGQLKKCFSYDQGQTLLSQEMKKGSSPKRVGSESPGTAQKPLDFQGFVLLFGLTNPA